MGHIAWTEFGVIGVSARIDELRRLAAACAGVELALPWPTPRRAPDALALLVLAPDIGAMFGVERHLNIALPPERQPAVYAWCATRPGSSVCLAEQEALLARLHGVMRASQARYVALSNQPVR